MYAAFGRNDPLDRVAFCRPTAPVLRYAAVLLVLTALMMTTGCAPDNPNDLDKLGTVAIQIKGQSFELWIADEDPERTRGLMFVTADEMGALPDGTRRGMFFAFDYEHHMSFWMKNTIIPLDIAYLNAGGEVTAIHTMAAMDDRVGQYTSGSRAQYAIEVNANVFGELGLEVGDRLEIPSID